MSQKELSLLRELLKTANYSLTKPRQAVFGALLASAEPQTMRQLIERTGAQLDRASVYRAVELFERLGIVHRVYMGWKYKLELSEDFLAHHHHLTCLQCGTVIDIHDDSLVEFFIAKVAEQAQFQPRRHQLEIDGLCAVCQKLRN